jgi:hypothetical protein
LDLLPERARQRVEALGGLVVATVPWISVGCFGLRLQLMTETGHMQIDDAKLAGAFTMAAAMANDGSILERRT